MASSDGFQEQVDDWIQEILKSPKNLAAETELMEQAKLAHKYFQEFDFDHSNKLTIEELHLLCEHLGLPVEKEEKEILAKLDEEGEGSLDLHSFVSWWLRRISATPNPMKQQEAIAKYTFARFDDDKSGFIDKNELEKLIDALGGNFTKEELDEAMEEIDTDHSGTIECSEFVHWWTNRAMNKRDSCSLISIKLKKLAAKANQVFATDIFTAAWKGDSELIENFLQSERRLLQSTDENDFGEGWTIWHYLCYQGNYEVLKSLLDTYASSVNINCVNNDGFTPLFYASQQGHSEIVKLLLTYNADPTIFGKTVLLSLRNESSSNNNDSLLSSTQFMSPVEFTLDYPELKPLFLSHSKCRQPKPLTQKEFQINCSCSNETIFVLSLIIMIPLKTISPLPIRTWTISLQWENKSFFLPEESSGMIVNNLSKVVEAFYSSLLNKVNLAVASTDPTILNTYNGLTLDNIILNQMMTQCLQIVYYSHYLAGFEIELNETAASELQPLETCLSFIRFFATIYFRIVNKIVDMMNYSRKASVAALLESNFESHFISTLNRLLLHPSISSNSQLPTLFESTIKDLQTAFQLKQPPGKKASVTNESKNESEGKTNLNLLQLKECIGEFIESRLQALPSSKPAVSSAKSNVQAVRRTTATSTAAKENTVASNNKQEGSQYFIIRCSVPKIKFLAFVASNNILFDSEFSEECLIEIAMPSP